MSYKQLALEEQYYVAIAKKAGKTLTDIASDMMASQKVRPTALQQFFKILTYHMYAFVLEKPLRLVGQIFCLAI